MEEVYLCDYNPERTRKERRIVYKLCSVRRLVFLMQGFILVAMCLDLWMIKHTPLVTIYDKHAIDHSMIINIWARQLLVPSEKNTELVKQLSRFSQDIKLSFDSKPIWTKQATTCYPLAKCSRSLKSFLNTKQGLKMKTSKHQSAHFYITTFVQCENKYKNYETELNLLETLAKTIPGSTVQWNRSHGLDHVFIMPSFPLQEISFEPRRSLIKKIRKHMPLSMMVFEAILYSSTDYSLWRDVVVPVDLTSVVSLENEISFGGQRSINDSEISIWAMGTKFLNDTRPNWVSIDEWELWTELGTLIEGINNLWFTPRSIAKSQNATFCLCIEPYSVYTSILLGCIPIMIASYPALAFEDLIDYSPFLIRSPLALPWLNNRAITNKKGLAQSILERLRDIPMESIQLARRNMEITRPLLLYETPNNIGLATIAMLKSISTRRARVHIDGDGILVSDTLSYKLNRIITGNQLYNGHRFSPIRPIANSLRETTLTGAKGSGINVTSTKRSWPDLNNTLWFNKTWPVLEKSKTTMNEFEMRVKPIYQTEWSKSLSGYLVWDYISNNNIYSRRVFPHDVLHINKDKTGLAEEYNYVHTVVKSSIAALHSNNTDVDIRENQFTYNRVDYLLGSEYIMHYSVILEGHYVRRYKAHYTRYLNASASSLSLTLLPYDVSKIYIVVSLYGRTQLCAKFINSFSGLIKKQLAVHLILVYSSLDEGNTAVKIIENMATMALGVSWNKVMTIVLRKKQFSRALALAEGAQKVPIGHIIFLCDIDFIIHSQFISHCAINTIKGTQVYFPVVYSLYPGAKHVRMDRGYYQEDGYGAACLYIDDYFAIGGYSSAYWNETIWASEGLDLYTRFISNSSYKVFRAYDPHILHTWHPRICPFGLNLKLYQQCTDTLLRNLGAQSHLAQVVYKKVPTSKTQFGYAKLLYDHVQHVERQIETRILDGKALGWKERIRKQENRKTPNSQPEYTVNNG